MYRYFYQHAVVFTNFRLYICQKLNRMKKNETPLGRLIYEKGYRKEFIIAETGINRSDFYKGLRYPVIFSDTQLRSIAKAIGVKFSEVQELINN